MRSGTIAFLAGILSLQQMSSLPALQWLWLLVPLLILSLFIKIHLLRLACFVGFGFLWALFHAHHILAQQLPVELEGKDVQLSGFVASIPERRDRLWRFEFDVDALHHEGKAYPSPGTIRLSWYDDAIRPAVGEAWQLTVRLKQAHGFMNPGAFDYEKWLFSHRIRATGYVRSKERQSLLPSSGVAYPLQQWRGLLRQKIQTILPEHPMRGLVTALTIGDRSAITAAQWTVLRESGTNHLIAISGLHIGFIAGLVYFLVKWLWARLGRWPLYVPAPKAGALAALLAALCYAALAGWSIPTQRAFIMVSVVMLSLLFMRVSTPSRTLALALLLVLLHDPLAVLGPGLWLSFAAVAIILFAMGNRSRHHRLWQKWGKVQWVVSLGLLPLLLTLFQQASLVSPLANFIAVPVVSLLLVPMLLVALMLSSLAIGQLLFSWGADGLQLLMDLLTAITAWPHILLVTPSPGIFSLSLALIGSLLLFMPRAWPARWLGLVLLIPLLSDHPKQLEHGQGRLTLLDVGQGLAAVVQTRNHTLVFDTGPRFSDAFDTGQAVVLPFLRQSAISQLDRLIISHSDNDHIGGAESLMAGLPVAEVLSSQPEQLFFDQVSLCQAGDAWEWDGVGFKILHPDAFNIKTGENNQSCVLQVTSPYARVLIPGDIEGEAEQALVERYGTQLRSDILIVPHHGSKTSSTTAFLHTVQPSYALFPVGYRNRHRFPHKNVLTRYEKSGIALFDTARHGAIEILLGPHDDQYRPITYRQAARRYWHHRLLPE